mmetsp:Transcript_70730/g.220711  ORF Transcript_70730/g.220711 Transcript_70730/m.220711 type:complete len:249 (+) Transcript_70730:394-1140(+)
MSAGALEAQGSRPSTLARGSGGGGGVEDDLEGPLAQAGDVDEEPRRLDPGLLALQQVGVHGPSHGQRCRPACRGPRLGDDGQEEHHRHHHGDADEARHCRRRMLLHRCLHSSGRVCRGAAGGGQPRQLAGQPRAWRRGIARLAAEEGAVPVVEASGAAQAAGGPAEDASQGEPAAASLAGPRLPRSASVLRGPAAARAVVLGAPSRERQGREARRPVGPALQGRLRPDLADRTAAFVWGPDAYEGVAN